MDGPDTAERFESLSTVVARALREDLGPGDATCRAVLEPGTHARAQIVRKGPGVLSGLDAAAEAFAQLGARLEPEAPEGVWEEGAGLAASVSGPAEGVLGAERVALNLLARLSGIATLTARFVRAVEGTDAVILDTRKTTPGLRALEKAAVRAGGGRNHRMGLDDAILIKENHAALAGGVGEAVRRAVEARADLQIEVECADHTEVRAALAAGAHHLLLDNMSASQLREAVALRDELDLGVPLEASGGITLDTVREVAQAGVEEVSIGALTHSAPALDMSMLVER